MPRVNANHVSNFLNWWGRELSGLVPKQSRVFNGPRGPATIIVLDYSKLGIAEDRGRSVRVLATLDRGELPWSAAALNVLDTIPLKSPVGIRVPLEACFSRTLEIPAAAYGDALALATLDLERATPFRKADVMTAVHVDDSARPIRGRITLRQLVLKRSTVEAVRTGIEARGLQVARIDCWNSARTAALPVDFLLGDAESRVETGARSTWLNRALAGAALAAAAAALALVVIKHENAIAVINQETSAARSQALDIGKRIARSETALAEAGRLGAWRRSRPFGIEVMEEVTRLLPDGAYLTEFNLDGDQLDLTGFATTAAPLLEAFERSGLFTDARFTTPFRLEPREDRERFSMRVRLRAAAASDPSAATGPAAPAGQRKG